MDPRGSRSRWASSAHDHFGRVAKAYLIAMLRTSSPPRSTARSCSTRRHAEAAPTPRPRCRRCRAREPLVVVVARLRLVDHFRNFEARRGFPRAGRRVPARMKGARMRLSRADRSRSRLVVHPVDPVLVGASSPRRRRTDPVAGGDPRRAIRKAADPILLERHLSSPPSAC